MKHRLIIGHYHLKDGGVTQVIKREITALQNSNTSMELFLITGDNRNEQFDGVTLVQIEELNYLSCENISPSEITQKRDSLKQKLLKYITPKTALHFHNPTLGKNPILTEVLQQLANREVKLLYHCHDFAEDRPSMMKEYTTYFKKQVTNSLEEMLYPDRENVSYLFANRDDMKRDSFREMALAKQIYMGNPVTVSKVEATKEELAPQLQVDPQKKWFLYPVRAITRKNIGEYLLLSLLNPEEAEWFITLAPQNPDEQKIYDRWVTLAEELKLPIHFNVAQKVAFEKLLFTADTVVTTSIREGFGMAFLEPWLLDTPVIGRDLPMVTTDFKEAGLLFPNLYDRIAITEEDYDFGAMNQQQKEEVLLKVASDRDFLKAVQQKNRFLKEIFNPLESTIIQKNRRVVEEKFSLKAFGKRLEKICD